MDESNLPEFELVPDEPEEKQPVAPPPQKKTFKPIAQQNIVEETMPLKKGGSALAVTGLILAIISLLAIGVGAYLFMGELKKINSELADIKGLVSGQKTEIADTKKTLSNYMADLDRINSRIDKANDVFQDFKSQLADTKSGLERANSQFKDMKDDLDRTSSLLDKASEALGDFKPQLAELKREIADFKSDLEGVKQKAEEANSRLNKASEKFSDFKSELNELKSRMDGYKATQREQSSNYPAPSQKAPKDDIEEGLTENQYLDKGDEFYNKQDWANAIRYYTKAIEKRSDWAIAYSNRGMAKYNIGDYKSAMYDFDTARKLDPGRKNECGNMIDKCKQKLIER